MKGFFLPWNEREKQVKWGEKKLYLPKETLSLTAVESGKKDEAMGYFSERVAEVVDYEEMAGFLKDLKEYHCFLEDEGAGIRRVSVAKKSKKDREVFAFRMVAEPNAFGTWKIFSIEREGKE